MLSDLCPFRLKFPLQTLMATRRSPLLVTQAACAMELESGQDNFVFRNVCWVSRTEFEVEIE